MNKPFSVKARLNSFVYAMKGIRTTFRKEHNFRIHVLAAILVITLGIYFSISRFEWLWLVACMGAVLTTELLNTALEVLADSLDLQPNPIVGRVKDTAAGAVLITALGSLIVGSIIFWPYLKPLFWT